MLTPPGEKPNGNDGCTRRQLQLRPEFSTLYPALPLGVWLEMRVLGAPADAVELAWGDDEQVRWLVFDTAHFWTRSLTLEP